MQSSAASLNANREGVPHNHEQYTPRVIKFFVVKLYIFTHICR